MWFQQPNYPSSWALVPIQVQDWPSNLSLVPSHNFVVGHCSSTGRSTFLHIPCGSTRQAMWFHLHARTCGPISQAVWFRLHAYNWHTGSLRPPLSLLALQIEIWGELSLASSLMPFLAHGSPVPFPGYMGPSKFSWPLRAHSLPWPTGSQRAGAFFTNTNLLQFFPLIAPTAKQHPNANLINPSS